MRRGASVEHVVCLFCCPVLPVTLFMLLSGQPVVKHTPRTFNQNIFSCLFILENLMINEMLCTVEKYLYT